MKYLDLRRETDGNSIFVDQATFFTDKCYNSIKKLFRGLENGKKKAFEWWDKLLYRPLFQQILHDDLQKMYLQYSCIVTTFWNWLPDNFLWMLRIKVQLGKVDNFREMYVRGKCRQTRQKMNIFLPLAPFPLLISISFIQIEWCWSSLNRNVAA